MGKEETPQQDKTKELEAKAAELSELQDFLDKREAELDAREKALAEKGPSVAPAADEERPLTKEQEKLIEEGCKAYGIGKKYLLKARIDPHTKEAVLITHGGAKVRFGKGMDAAALDPVRVDGVSRKKPRHLIGKKK